MTTKRRKAKNARRVCVWKKTGLFVEWYKTCLTVGKHPEAENLYRVCPFCGRPIEIKGPKGGRK